jgi:PAS domain S-box-containing protein
MRESLRKSGINIVGDVPWGTHINQFYDTKEDLIDILVSYFKVGLENNEFCLWITSQPLEVEDAKEALRRAVPDVDSLLEKGQIEIIPYTHWYMKDGVFDSNRVLNGWVEKLNQALANGYDGFRLTGNTFWLEKEDWGYFVDYMEKMDDIIGKYRMIALGSYFADKYSATEIIEIVSNHQFSLIKKEGKWKRIDNFGWKKAEETAIRATKDWEHTFDAVPDLIAIINNEYQVVRANKAMAARLGVTPEECIGITCYRVIHGADEPPSNCPHRQLLKDELEHTKEVHEDNLGGDFIVSVSPLHDSEGKLAGCIHVARDINERKKAEEALRKAHNGLEDKVKERTAELEEAYKSLLENERRLNEAQKMAHFGIWDWDLATNKSYWSDEAYRIVGLNHYINELMHKKLDIDFDEVLSYIHPDGQDAMENAIKQALNGKSFDTDSRIISAYGEERIVHIQGEVIFDEKSTPVRMRGTLQDITEHKKSEERIQSLANIVESSNDAIGTISFDGIITSWNKGAEQVYGYSAEEVIGKTVSILAPPHLSEETKKLSEMIKKRERVYQYETLRLRKDGKIIDVSINLSPVFDVYGKLTVISFVVRDVTNRKEAEESLANIEIVRKKEIHHRIKNNLQVISSLLDLQAEKFNNRKDIKDSEVLEAFRESQDRVISMALIHEELYKGGRFETLDFSPYIEVLAENLFLTYRFGNTNISLNMELEENILLDIDTAVPLGMIVNELVANSLKHAFISRDKGEIRIILRREENGKSINSIEEIKNESCKSTSFVLTVSDNGVGIPENLVIEELESLGFKLVITLVDQLDGELELKRNNGTEFTIRFAVKEISEQAPVPTPQLII